MTARSRQRQDTRERLIQHAHRLFARRGIGVTRMTDVARAAKVAHGTVFLHFPTRDDLLAAVIQRYGGALAARVHQLAAEQPTVRDVLAAHLAGLRAHEDFYHRLVTEPRDVGKAARTTLLAIQSAVSVHLGEAQAREVAAGTLRRVPLALLFNTWVGLLNHYVSHRELFAPDESVLDRWGTVLLNHYVGLLRPDSKENAHAKKVHRLRNAAHQTVGSRSG